MPFWSVHAELVLKLPASLRQVVMLPHTEVSLEWDTGPVGQVRGQHVSPTSHLGLSCELAIVDLLDRWLKFPLPTAFPADDPRLPSPAGRPLGPIGLVLGDQVGVGTGIIQTRASHSGCDAFAPDGYASISSLAEHICSEVEEAARRISLLILGVFALRPWRYCFGLHWKATDVRMYSARLPCRDSLFMTWPHEIRSLIRLLTVFWLRLTICPIRR